MRARQTKHSNDTIVAAHIAAAQISVRTETVLSRLIMRRVNGIDGCNGTLHKEDNDVPKRQPVSSVSLPIHVKGNHQTGPREQSGIELAQSAVFVEMVNHAQSIGLHSFEIPNRSIRPGEEEEEEYGVGDGLDCEDGDGALAVTPEPIESDTNNKTAKGEHARVLANFGPFGHG